jgi:branched-chain amino acid transport system permease protein
VWEILGLAVVAGVGLGGLYGLIAMGYTLVLAASAVFNFVQGSVVVAGGLGMLGLWQVLGWPFLAVVAIVLIGGGVLGLLTYVLSVHPIAVRRDVHELTEGTLVSTFGLGLALNSVMALTFGSTVVSVNSYVSTKSIVVAGLPIRPLYIAMIAVTLLIAAIMELVVRRTRTGLVLRATVQDREGASLAGIHVTRVVLRSFALAGALAAVAGLLMVPATSASAALAPKLTLYGFAGMAIGGYGSFKGAVLGGIIVGVASSVASVYIDAAWVSVVMYALVLAILLVRPRGLFGSAGEFGSAGLRRV